MIELTAAEVAAACGVETGLDATVSGVAVDPRSVRPGDLFVALAADPELVERRIAAARAAGASAALVASGHGQAAGEFAIPVPDPLIGLGQLAAEVRRRSPARVAAITGSTGKTSVERILEALLERAWPRAVVASAEAYDTELGLPLTLAQISAGTRAVVCELGMVGPGQIAYLAELCRPDVAVITAVGPVHLELAGTVEAVAEAKAEILASLGPDQTAVVPHGEALLDPYLDLCRARVVTFGEADGADVRLVEFDGERADFALGGRILRVPVSFPERHHACNMAAALAAAGALGVDVDAAVSGGLVVSFPHRRGQEIELESGGLLIPDSHAANPASMAAALRHLTIVAGGRPTVAVLGDMSLRRDEDAERAHREVGALAAELGVGRVVAVGPLARAYGGAWYPDRFAALAALPEHVRAGDAVLVKGRRELGLEALVEALEP